MQIVVHCDLVGHRIQILIEAQFGIFRTFGIYLFAEEVVREFIKGCQEKLCGCRLARLGDQLVDTGCIFATVKGC